MLDINVIKKFLKNIYVRLVLVLAIISSITGYFLMSQTVTTDNAYVKGVKIPIVSEVSGFVKKVFVYDNSEVSKDDKLLKIDDADLVFEYKKTLETLAVTEKKFLRNEKLNANKFVATKELETARAEYSLNLIKKKELENKIANTVITSPINGIATKQILEPGQYILAYKPLFFVVGTSSVWVEANFKETQIKDIKSGQRAEIRVDAYPNLVFKGRVDTISPATGSEFSILPLDMSYGNFVKIVQRIPVKISLLKPNKLLKPGMSADVKIYTSSR